MKNRFFRIAVCFTLIISMAFCEATMCFAVEGGNAIAENAIAEKVELKEYSFKDGETYLYTGAQIKPEVTTVKADITYKEEDGTTKTVTKTIKSFKDVTYKSNTSIGTGYVVITIEGKRIELPFTIELGKITSLKATPSSNHTIKISWNSVVGAAGYIIYRSEKATSGFKKIKTITSGSTTSYKNTKLSLGATYYYKVCPFRTSKGESINGTTSKAVKQKVRPTAPKIKSVKRSNYETINVTWGKVSGADGYCVYRSSSPKGEYKRVATVRSANKLSYKDKGRTCGVRYYYKVRSYEMKGLKRYLSYMSEYKSGRTVPSRTQFNSDTISWYSSVELHWKKSKGATGYEIYRSKSYDGGFEKIKTIKNVKTTKWTNNGLNGSNKYYFKIRPYKVVKGSKVYGGYSKVYTKYLVPKKLSTLVKKYEDVPYRLGGNTPKGWDCSGFVQWATYYLSGKKIGRTASDQARGGKAVNKNKMSTWKPGDVLVYKRNGGGVSHVGLYIGGGKMMHALNYRYGTVIQDVDYYEKWDGGNYLAGVRRY